MLSIKGLRVSYSDIADDLHVSGHASSSEIKMLMAMTRPKYVMGTGGTHRHAVQFGKLAREMGIPQDRILASENQPLIIEPGGVVRLGEPIPLRTVYVESGIIARSDKPIADRQAMFQEGVVVTVVTQSSTSTEVDFIPKGIITHIEPSVLARFKTAIRSMLDAQDISRDKVYSKDKIAKEVSRLFLEEYGKNPLVIPIIIEN
jgi:ribonuclease J